VSQPIVRLFGLFALLFAVLVGFTSRWTVFEAGRLRDNPLNRRALLDELRVKRGDILAANGDVLARSIHGPGDTWQRTYPAQGLFSQSVGYSFPARGLPNAGLERSRNRALLGEGTELDSVFRQIRGAKQVGDTIRTTLDPAAQRVALSELASAGDGRGSVVALDPRTGAIKVMASLPDFDPNDLRAARAAPGSPLFNRATQSSYPPGSTFKVVTAAAAIDSGRYTPSSIVDGSSPQTFSGVPLNNDGGQSFGPIDLTTALTFSVNTAWAGVGESLGRATMAKYMKRFGFYAKPRLDYPRDQMIASGEYANGRLLNPLSPRIDTARMAIGQDKLAVTPLQMAAVAAAIANGGNLMRPHMTDRVVDRDGRTVERVRPTVQSTVVKPSSARRLAAMMSRVVAEGTGTAAALSGIEVAGKTGTAQVGPLGANVTQPWFIAFAPVAAPRVAIAVTVERTDGGFGGTVAAPIAKDVMQTLLRSGG